MKRFKDGLDHFICVSQHVAVPKSQDAKTLGSKEGVAMQIFRGALEMLAAIMFDDDGGFETDEVADIDSDRVLSPELEAVELTAAQARPETPLGVRLIRS